MDYQEKYPINNSPGGDSVKEAVINNRNELLNVAKYLSEQPSGGGGLRQRVLYGSSNNGVFNFLTSSDLGITIDGRNVPVVITFADGFGDSGGIDYIESIKSMVSAWVLPANNTSYLYVDRSENGALSYGSTSIRPVYSTIPPNSIINAYYFNTIEQKMYMYNGTEWVSKMRVFVASVTTNATRVTNITYLKNEDASSMVVLAGSVDETALADDAITEVKIKNASVTADKLGEDVTEIINIAIDTNVDEHNTDSSAHTAILNAHNADVNAHTPILNAIKAISGMSAYDIAPSKTIDAIIKQVNNMITTKDDADKQSLAPTLALVKTLLSTFYIKNSTDVINALDTETLSRLGVRYSLTNQDAWYICFGKLFGGLIIQGGTAVGGKAVFPIQFNKALTVVGTLFDTGTSSHENYDDAVTYTNTGVNFRGSTHKYIAFGI